MQKQHSNTELYFSNWSISRTPATPLIIYKSILLFAIVMMTFKLHANPATNIPLHATGHTPLTPYMIEGPADIPVAEGPADSPLCFSARLFSR